MKPAFTITSPETQTDYQIRVLAPAGGKPVHGWPTVLFMDGDDQFSAAAAAYQKLHDAGQLQPLLLVAVGYGASYGRPGNHRGRDYTPTTNSDEEPSGGGAKFLNFLCYTLWPELGTRYPISHHMRGIAGHSLGSLLALQALWQEPTFFTHYLVSSPSIWWDDRSILRLASERHLRNSVLQAHVFLSVGSKDSCSMTGDLAVLEEQLKIRPFENLRLHTEKFAGRDHFNVLPDAFASGLKQLFGGE